MLPGKLFEYLASRRPVLGIGQSDGAMAAILRRAKAGEVYGWDDSSGISACIGRNWDAFKKGESCMSTGNIEQYSRKFLAGRMASLMESMIERK